MMYHLRCWHCRGDAHSAIYVSIIICDDCLNAPATARAAKEAK